VARQFVKTVDHPVISGRKISGKFTSDWAIRVPLEWKKNFRVVKVLACGHERGKEKRAGSKSGLR
jgi:hypothetical protein